MSKLMSRILQDLLKRIGLFVFPRVDDPEPGEEDVSGEEDPGEDAGEDAGDDPEIQASGDDGGESEEDDPPPKPIGARQREMIALRKRAQDAEKMAKEALETVQRAAPRQPDESQRLFAEEDAKLQNPETPELEKWQIRSNRTLRENEARSRAALAQAQEMQDQTAYQQKVLENPVYGKYSAKVEAKLKELRASGQNAPRALLAAVLVGQDVLAGKAKAKAAPTKTTVARGKPTGARSDTPRGNASASSKLRSRLENVQI